MIKRRSITATDRRFVVPVTVVALLAILTPRGAEASPCCASSAAAPSMISGDDRAQVTWIASRSVVIGDAQPSGAAVFRSPREDETTKTYRLDGALLLADRWQAGISAPLVHRSVVRGQRAGEVTRLGDLKLTGAFEVLPEWEYSEWKPKGYAFLQLTLPTGRSIYDATDPLLADATGRGFTTVALGSLWVKSWSAWDAFVIPETHYSFARTFDADLNGDTTSVAPGFGASLAIGGGRSFGAWRIGARFQPAWNQPRTLRLSSGESRTAYQLVWDTGIDATYLASDDWSIAVAYTDQTVFGPAVNSTLSRSFALTLQRRWPR